MLESIPLNDARDILRCRQISMILIGLVSNSRKQIARFRLTVSDCDCFNVIVIVVPCFVVGRNYRQGGQMPLLSITRIDVDYFLRIR